MKEYEEKFPNIIRIFSKENGGLGDTRNFGIPYAKGKYVTFVDSDDYIKEKLYQQLAIDYCCQVSDIKDDKNILRNMKNWKAGDSLKKRMIVS